MKSLAAILAVPVGLRFRRAALARHAQRSTARALLGAEHPLVRVMDAMHARLEQAIALMTIVAAGVAGALTGVADTRAALAAATQVEVVVVCALVVLVGAKRDHVLDLIIEGRGDLELPAVAHERKRLLDPRYRAQLSRSLEALRDEAEHPMLHSPSTYPLHRRRVIAAAAHELVETAGSLRCDHAGVAGVAMAERLLGQGDSPLYGENAERLGVELRRCRFLLAGGASPTAMSVPGRDPRPGTESVSASPGRPARP
jgi:hypothetical protein